MIFSGLTHAACLGEYCDALLSLVGLSLRALHVPPARDGVLRDGDIVCLK